MCKLEQQVLVAKMYGPNEISLESLLTMDILFAKIELAGDIYDHDKRND